MQYPYNYANGWHEGYMLTTHKYNPDYSYLDKGKTLPWVWRQLSETFYEGDDYDDWGSLVIRIQVHGEHTMDELRAAMRDEWRKGCSCEFDCCGHLTGGLQSIERPTNRKKNEYILKVHYGRNY